MGVSGTLVGPVSQQCKMPEGLLHRHKEDELRSREPTCNTKPASPCFQSPARSSEKDWGFSSSYFYP